MNKHIKHIKSLLAKPDYDTEGQATYYLNDIIADGRLKPRFKIDYPQTLGKKVDFDSVAITLSPDVVGCHSNKGITVYGRVHEDYYEWVNLFLVVSDSCMEYIVGDFEGMVYASSKRFYEEFIANNRISVWDYMDI